MENRLQAITGPRSRLRSRTRNLGCPHANKLSEHLFCMIAMAAVLMTGSSGCGIQGLKTSHATEAVPSRDPLRREAASPYSGRVGVSSHLAWDSTTDIVTQLKRIKAGGVDWVREDILWDRHEPSRGTFNWSMADNLMAAAAVTHMNVLGIIDYSAPWASSGGIHDPPDAADYAVYAAAVVSRYGSGGSFWAAHTDLTPMPLPAVELWNEPESATTWKPEPDPSAYAAIVRAASTAIRAINPGVTIVASAAVIQTRRDGQVLPWFDAMLNADPSLGSFVDAWGIHPYPDPPNVGPYDTSSGPGYRTGRVALAHDIAIKHNANKPFWITEIGWSTATRRRGGVDEATQSTYDHDMLVRAVQEWGSFVARTFIYSWDLSNGKSHDREGNYGMRRADGSLKPAWTAITTLITKG